MVKLAQRKVGYRYLLDEELTSVKQMTHIEIRHPVSTPLPMFIYEKSYNALICTLSYV